MPSTLKYRAVIFYEKPDSKVERSFKDDKVEAMTEFVATRYSDPLCVGAELFCDGESILSWKEPRQSR